MVADACEELGDVLFQVVFHSVLASEEGLFTLADVAHEVHRKLVSRHPHVFGDVEATTPDAVVANWEVLKKAEKGRTSVTEGIPSALPVLALAGKLQRKAASVGLRGSSLDELRSTVRQMTERLGAEAAIDQAQDPHGGRPGLSRPRPGRGRGGWRADGGGRAGPAGGGRPRVRPASRGAGVARPDRGRGSRRLADMSARSPALVPVPGTRASPNSPGTSR